MHHSFNELFEKSFPIQETKMTFEPPDLFLGDCSIEDLKSDRGLYLLFTPSKLYFDIHKKNFNESLFCSACLYLNGDKISETFTFNISPSIESVILFFSLFVNFFKKARKGNFFD